MPDIDFDSLPQFAPDIFESLERSLGKTDLYELLSYLPEEGDRVLVELANARQSGTLEAVRVATHALKGAAGNFGAIRLEAISKAMNDSGTTLEDLNKLAGPLERCIEALKTELT